MPDSEFIRPPVSFAPSPLEVFPVRSGSASSRFREVDPTSLPFVHTSIQRKMQFRSHFVHLGSGPQARFATRGTAPQTGTLVEGRQCRLLAAGRADTCLLFFFS